MKSLCRNLCASVISFTMFSAMAKAQPDLTPYDVIWETQSENSSGSMPIGNGDIGANVWVTADGVVHFLLSKTDAFSEIGRLLKIGRIDLAISPDILRSKKFKQQLHIEDGMIQIFASDGERNATIRCWADAHQPVIHIEGQSNFPLTAEARNMMWRTTSRPLKENERHSAYGVGFREEPFWSEVDTVLNSKNGIAWCHRNNSSIWKMTLENQHIADFERTSQDPLLHQNFGAWAGGKNFKVINDKTIRMAQPASRFDLDIVIEKTKTTSESEWLSSIEKKAMEIRKMDLRSLAAKHRAWWKNFWDRHYIIIRSEKENETTFTITQAYMLQRYMNACAGRGKLPIKFNGSIFTVDLNEDMGSGKKGFDADYRSWGGNYWFQNTRLIYWTMYHSGDTEFMRSFFDMYIDALPLARFRTRTYFQHDGAYFPETLTPWGSYLIDNYGWDRKGKKDGVSDNLYIRYYWQSGLELSTMMMEYLGYTGDTVYFQRRMVPFIRDIITFYDQHYPRDAEGKIRIEPAQALETFQEGITNPAPEIAGLLQNLREILHLSKVFKDNDLLLQCKRMLDELPPLPVKDSLGSTMLMSGSNLGERANIENPELYAIFPYRLFGIDQPLLQTALHTFDNRFFKKTGGWHQDAIQAALLGKTEEAKEMVTFNFTNKNATSRFPVFWGPNYDWVPDQDHGTVAMRALQNMLIQSRNDTSYLLPAWPKEWNVMFKVHLPGKKIVEGKYEKGKGVQLTNRPKDIHLTIGLE